MAEKVGQMTKEELRELIESSIEQKLIELFGDPESDLEIKETIRDRLLKQRVAVASGERGETLEVVMKHLELD